MDKTIMKNLIFFFLVVFAVASCSDEGSVPEPPEPLSKEDSIKITLLKPSPTKEPYILLEDSGIEAELIAQGLDTDNQINGKISLADADKIELFGQPVSVIVANPEDPEFYSYEFYYRYHTVMPILKKEYKEKTGSELIVKELSDVNSFKNLRKLYVIFETETIDSLSLSANDKLEVFGTVDSRIRIIDFNGCKQLRKIQFITSPHPLYGGLLDKLYISQCSKLEYLSYVGNPRTLNISQNINLKYLEISFRRGVHGSDIEIEKLDLCNLPYLESLHERTGTYKNIYLSKNVYAHYEKSKQQYIANGFQLLDYGTKVHACE
jgi:hypothetical protein